MSSAINIVKRLRESRRDIPDNLIDVSSEIHQRVRNEVINFMVSEGFPKEEAEDYIRVDAYSKGGYLCIEVGAELSYESLENLCDKLNPIVSAYDKESYFEPVDPGIIAAWMTNDVILSSMKDSKEVLSVDDMREELVKYGDYTEEEANMLTSGPLIQAWMSLPKTVKESEEKRMEFATDSEANEWAEENGYEITKTQNGRGSKACIAWMRKVNEDNTVYYHSSDTSYSRDNSEENALLKRQEKSHPYVGKKVRWSEDSKVYTVTGAYEDSRGVTVRCNNITMKPEEYRLLVDSVVSSNIEEYVWSTLHPSISNALIKVTGNGLDDASYDYDGEHFRGQGLVIFDSERESDRKWKSLVKGLRNALESEGFEEFSLYNTESESMNPDIPVVAYRIYFKAVKDI